MWEAPSPGRPPPLRRRGHTCEPQHQGCSRRNPIYPGAQPQNLVTDRCDSFLEDCTCLWSCEGAVLTEPIHTLDCPGPALSFSHYDFFDLFFERTQPGDLRATKRSLISPLPASGGTTFLPQSPQPATSHCPVLSATRVNDSHQPRDTQSRTSGNTS